MDEGGRPVVSRDYRLETTCPTAGGLFIQGNTEHSHGLTSSLLSNIAVRSAEILQSIDAELHSLVGASARRLRHLLHTTTRPKRVLGHNLRLIS